MLLAFRALFKLLIGFVLFFLLIFAPIGTISFWNGWLLLISVFVPIIFIGAYLLCKKPDLLEKRLKGKEVDKEQGKVVLFSSILFLVGLPLSSLDVRYGWLLLPDWVAWIGVVNILISFIGYFEVLRENEYLSRIVEVQEGQKVIDTGLYRFVRHPMYSVTVLLFMSMPLVLCSFLSFIVFLFYPFIIVKRIYNEEKYLEKELMGYIEYKQRVKYRLFPFIW